ncbi:glycosyltransferase [Candidatus Aerophobetes bacterium]|nr:glycosyltransferase [Candidatus Aerophobetes bacterium]
MKICFVSDQSFPSRGGEGVSTQNFCLGLKEKGDEVVLFTSRVKNPPSVREIKIYRFFSIRISQGKGYLAFPSLKKIFYILKREKIDIVHINLPTYLGWQALRGAKKLGIPVVLGFHVQTGNVIPSSIFLIPFKKIIEKWFSYFYKKGNIVLAPSFFAKRILRDKYNLKYLDVVSNGVDLNRFNPNRVDIKNIKNFKKRYSLDDSSVLIYVGRLAREKNVCYLLKIMKYLKKMEKDIKLLIVGKGGLEKKIKKEIKHLGMDKEIVLTGYLENIDLLCAYSYADIFILPSFNELQSIATLEAMAMKNTILVGDHTENAAQELVKEGINGYTFSLRRPCDVAEKIYKIVSCSKLKKDMQENSFKMVQEHDMQRSILKLRGIYKELKRKSRTKKTGLED